MPAEQHGQPSPKLSSVAIILPAFNAGAQLPALVGELSSYGYAGIVVVDDGSAPDQAWWLESAQGFSGVELLRHPRNLGKGRALKTGFAFVHKAYPTVTTVVTADADGQHLSRDIARVAIAASESPARVILGARTLERGVPLRSWIGNALTRHCFRIATGVAVVDTQTGLRAFPASLLDALKSMDGERYEYETAVLARLCMTLGRPREVLIDTVYLRGNRGSHFRPGWDSARIARILASVALERLAARTATGTEGCTGIQTNQAQETDSTL